MVKGVVLILFISFFNICIGQDIVINEIMTANESTIEDDFGESSDWIEIYNPSAQAISLNQWFLSDHEDNLNLWQFPDTTIFPNQFILIFCSGRDTVSAYFHSNFKLKSNGEEIIISNENQNIVDQFDAVSLNNDISYGRKQDGNTSKGFFYVSSPGYSNLNNFELAEISFSQDAGFYNSNISIALSAGNTTGQIHFTVNSNEPHPDSSYTYVFDTPIALSDIQETEPNYSYIPTTPEYNSGYYVWSMPEGNIEKHVVIRAQVFSGNQALCKVKTNTYFLGADIMERFSLPVLSIIADSISLFDYDTGIYVPGKRQIEGVVKSGNYWERGDAWERKGTIEYFSETGTLLHEQDLGIRMHGNLTRAAPQKAFQFFPRSIYDESNTLSFPFFEELPFNDYKRIISRSVYSSHSGTLVRDEIAQEVARSLNVNYQQWQPAITFLNGEFWGLQVLREKQNEYYLQQHYGINPDSVDIITLWGVVENGDIEEYSIFLNFMLYTDLSIPENYEIAKSMIDVPAYIDYYIAEIFLGNGDWPGNNYTFWREKGVDNKWQWFLYDLDAALKNVEYDNLRHATGDSLNGYNPEWSTRFFNAMLQNEEFKNHFLDRFVYVLNNDFCFENILPIIDKWESLVEDEVESTLHRWGMLGNIDDWRESIEAIRHFLMYRSGYVKTHLEEYFGIDSLEISCITDVPEISTNNTINLFPNPAKNEVYLRSSTKIYSWEIYNMNGAFIKGRKDCNRFLEQIDISNISPGIFSIVIFDGQNYSAMKIVKID